MNLKKYSSLFKLIVTALIGLIIHKAVSHFIIPKEFEDNFVYSTPMLYLLFTLLSMIILLALTKVNEVAKDYVGYAFLAFTMAKMVIAYAFLRPIIHINLPKTPTERLNFFIVFIYFLAIETILTIRILNNKQ
jgi:uncharacterized membrane protein YoaK (UPF0700 family)